VVDVGGAPMGSSTGLGVPTFHGDLRVIRAFPPQPRVLISNRAGPWARNANPAAPAGSSPGPRRTALAAGSGAPSAAMATQGPMPVFTENARVRRLRPPGEYAGALVGKAPT